MSELELYAKLAAFQLTGKSTQVYFREPIVSGAGGTAFLDESGQQVIEVRPERTPEFMLYAFCHECAHLKLKHTKQKIRARAPGTITLDWPHELKARATQESQADELAHKWIDYAHKNARQSGDYLLERLRALAIMPIVERALERVRT